MNRLTPENRVVLLMHDVLGHYSGKIGNGLLRYSVAPIVAVIDRATAANLDLLNSAADAGAILVHPLFLSVRMMSAQDVTVGASFSAEHRRCGVQFGPPSIDTELG